MQNPITTAIAKNTRLRMAASFALVLFFSAGMRACDDNITMGFPVVAAVFGKEGSHYFWSCWSINFVFALLCFAFVYRFTASTRWQTSKAFRIGGYTSLGFLLYGEFFLYSGLLNNKLIGENLSEFFFAVWFFPFAVCDSIFGDYDFLAYLNAHPALKNYFPHQDDLELRLTEPLAILLVFLLGWGVANGIYWIQKKRQQRKINAEQH